MSRKPYVREVSKTRWFLRQPRYMRYMMREVTCLSIGAYALVLVLGIKRLSEGRAAYEGFLQALASPGGILFHLVVLAFALYHTASWFNVTPKAMPVQIGESFVSGGVIVGAHYGAWIVISLAVLLLAGAF
ncbi:MAG: fumarate reductase subunit C [Betaproteobacteria bacterium]|nr:fumarate reductase subunit C [Betaproteobacteria bacterium]